MASVDTATRTLQIENRLAVDHLPVADQEEDVEWLTPVLALLEFQDEALQCCLPALGQRNPGDVVSEDRPKAAEPISHGDRGQVPGPRAVPGIGVRDDDQSAVERSSA